MKKRRNELPCYDVPILAGEAKGKKILIPDIPTTRSSKSILRESLFDTLQFDIIGKGFVEVFAGSGSVGLEAISRGAAHAYFIEKNRDVYRILEENIHRVGSGRATPIHGDSFELFPSLLERLQNDPIATYFYLDPPFSIREGMETVYDRMLSLIAQIPETISEKIIVEHMSRLELPEIIGRFRRQKQKRFGKSSLSYYAPIRDG